MLVRLIKKLNTKYYSLFEVDRVLDSYSYKLKLLYELEKIHNIFHPSFLCLENQLPLLEQINLLSRYQLVRCGWGAKLPATLYPAIYIWPTAIY
jgi:hypothetical protein